MKNTPGDRNTSSQIEVQAGRLMVHEIARVENGHRSKYKAKPGLTLQKKQLYDNLFIRLPQS